MRNPHLNEDVFSLIQHMLLLLLLLLSHFSRVRLCATPIDGSPPGSPVPGILQARTLEWVAMSFSNAWKWKVKVKSLSCVRLFATPWTTAYQAPVHGTLQARVLEWGAIAFSQHMLSSPYSSPATELRTGGLSMSWNPAFVLTCGRDVWRTLSTTC